MLPLIEIRRAGPDAYAYRVHADGTAAQDDGIAFGSLALCLFDAGAALESYFPRVEVRFEEMFLGAYATDMLWRRSEDVARRITQHFQPA